jgi:hypothetical protein
MIIKEEISLILKNLFFVNDTKSLDKELIIIYKKIERKRGKRRNFA